MMISIAGFPTPFGELQALGRSLHGNVHLSGGSEKKPSKKMVDLFGLKAWEVSTLPETNISPENGGPLVKGILMKSHHFQGLC